MFVNLIGISNVLSVVYIVCGGVREKRRKVRREGGQSSNWLATFIFLNHLSLPFHFSLRVFLVDDNDFEVLLRFSQYLECYLI